MKRLIPNSLTATNLFCGMLALVFVGTGDLTGAAWAIFASLVADFLDGFSARMLKVTSPIGRELDSLADMVTFGAIPGFIMARMIQEAMGLDFLPDTLFGAQGGPWFLIGFLITIFSALRLAKFNLDTRQSDAFYGVPTPANTLLILSCWMIVQLQPDLWLAQILNNPWVLIALTVISSWLLVADIRLLNLKFKNFSFRENRFRFILIGSGLILLALFQYVAIPFVILLYLGLSLVANRFSTAGEAPKNGVG